MLHTCANTVNLLFEYTKISCVACVFELSRIFRVYWCAFVCVHFRVWLLECVHLYMVDVWGFELGAKGPVVEETVLAVRGSVRTGHFGDSSHGNVLWHDVRRGRCHGQASRTSIPSCSVFD